MIDPNDIEGPLRDMMINKNNQPFIEDDDRGPDDRYFKNLSKQMEDSIKQFNLAHEKLTRHIVLLHTFNERLIDIETALRKAKFID